MTDQKELKSVRKIKKNKYLFLNNDEYGKSREYQPKKYIEKIFNEETEQYEYKERIQNLKLELENENEMLNELITLRSEKL